MIIINPIQPYLINFPHDNKYSDFSSPRPNESNNVDDLADFVVVAWFVCCGGVSLVSRVPQDTTCKFPRE